MFHKWQPQVQPQVVSYVPVESAATPPPPLAPPPPPPQTSYQIIDPQVQSMDVQYWNNYTIGSAPTTPTFVMAPHAMWSEGQHFFMHVYGWCALMHSAEKHRGTLCELIEQGVPDWETEWLVLSASVLWKARPDTVYCGWGLPMCNIDVKEPVI